MKAMPSMTAETVSPAAGQGRAGALGLGDLRAI